MVTKSNLRRRHIINETECPRCCQGDETEHHIFFECPYAKQLWRASGISNDIINSSTTTLTAKLEECFKISTASSLTHFQDLPIWILWRIWKSRNMLLFQQKQFSWSKVLQQSRSDAREWEEHGKYMELLSSTRRHRTGTLQTKEWQRPETGWYKCNIDGSFISSDLPAQAGWIVRDSRGTFKGAGQSRGHKVTNAFESEFQALIMAMQHCWSKGYTKVIFEGDCKKIIDILQSKTLHFEGYNWTREAHR